MTTDARRLAILAARAPDATVCPSEVARAMTSQGDWRAAMPMIHGAVDRLFAEGAILLSWKGHRLTSHAGPYRIAINTRPPD